MHQVCGLNDEVLHAVLDCTLKSLLNIVDLLAVTGLNMVDDDLGCESSSDRPVRECGLQCILYSLDIGGSAVVEGSSEADDKKLVLADVVRIFRIILGRIAGIPSEIIRIRFLSLDKLLLSIGQGIPCRLGSCALFVCLVSSFLNIDRIDQSCDLIGQFLIALDLRGRFRIGCGFGFRFLLAACCKTEHHAEDKQDTE